jgi:hypothetical protein
VRQLISCESLIEVLDYFVNYRVIQTMSWEFVLYFSEQFLHTFRASNLSLCFFYFTVWALDTVMYWLALILCI